ncbi:MAG TPA: hypothetical protein DEB40_10905 [Elusimicrobia bacterium]|nr:hypothetical protein [Elusimicrobiota bacterium]HBT62239.1 hypothetical protein [Elusimicrobiota bacterium]
MAAILISSSNNELLSNAQIHRLLGLQVAKDILGATEDSSPAEVGPLSNNYYSFTFSVKARTHSGSDDVFIKIPKADMRGMVPRILPLTLEDRRMAQEEESSLRLLAQKWNAKEQEVLWVNLRGTVPEYNALVTDRIFADEALPAFRRFDILRRLGFQEYAQRLQRQMARMGAALGRFHQANRRPLIFRLNEALPKLGFYCQDIAARSGSAWPLEILRILDSMADLELSGIEVPTLKGIDIRNMLIGKQDRIYLLDPGKTKPTHREADLARFIMTYRILYWGSLKLLLLREPDPRGESAFLKAYYANSSPPNPRMLDLFLLKELLKHWQTALVSLQRLNWSAARKRLAAWIYVHPFYTRQIAAQLEVISNHHMP